MKNKSPIMIIMVIIMTIVLTITACSSSTNTQVATEETKAPTTVTENPVEATKETNLKKVLYITPGTLGDNGFSDSVNSGIQRIAKEYGAEVKVIENGFDSSKYAQSVEAAFAWEPDVLFTDSYGMEDLIKDYSLKYPNVKVVNLDFVLQNEANTISSVTFIQEEGSFMAGVVAALVTTSNLPYANPEKIVGAMGGQDIWVIRSFMHGYEQGVKYIDPSIKIVTNFAGTFSDPVVGKSAAKQLYAQGADIIFQIAGLTGSGALEAASEEHKYVIGVDSNQNGTYPGYVVTSMVKDLGGAVFEVYKMMVEGTYEPGKTYEFHYGYAGTYLAIDDFTKKILPEEMLTKISDIEKKLESGEIVVERYPKE